MPSDGRPGKGVDPWQVEHLFVIIVCMTTGNSAVEQVAPPGLPPDAGPGPTGLPPPDPAFALDPEPTAPGAPAFAFAFAPEPEFAAEPELAPDPALTFPLKPAPRPVPVDPPASRTPVSLPLKAFEVSLLVPLQPTNGTNIAQAT